MRKPAACCHLVDDSATPRASRRSRTRRSRASSPATVGARRQRYSPTLKSCSSPAATAWAIPSALARSSCSAGSLMAPRSRRAWATEACTTRWPRRRLTAVAVGIRSTCWTSCTSPPRSNSSGASQPAVTLGGQSRTARVRLQHLAARRGRSRRRRGCAPSTPGPGRRAPCAAPAPTRRAAVTFARAAASGRRTPAPGVERHHGERSHRGRAFPSPSWRGSGAPPRSPVVTRRTAAGARRAALRRRTWAP